MKNAESADQLAIILTLEGEKKLGRTIKITKRRGVQKCQYKCISFRQYRLSFLEFLVKFSHLLWCRSPIYIKYIKQNGKHS